MCTGPRTANLARHGLLQVKYSGGLNTTSRCVVMIRLLSILFVELRAGFNGPGVFDKAVHYRSYLSWRWYDSQ